MLWCVDNLKGRKQKSASTLAKDNLEEKVGKKDYPK
jgi:hypothetical protein